MFDIPAAIQVAAEVDTVGGCGTDKVVLTNKLLAGDVHAFISAVTVYEIPFVIPLIKPPTPIDGPAGVKT